MPPLSQNDIVRVLRRKSSSSRGPDGSSPKSPPILADFRLKNLQQQVAAEKKKGADYKYFVLGSAKYQNIVQVATLSDHVMKDIIKGEEELKRYGGLSFMINALPTRGYFDFDCPVFSDEDTDTKARELETWIKTRFLVSLYSHLKIPKTHHGLEIISTKHRKKKASFHVIIPIVADDPRAWSYLMKDFWKSHDVLLAESWAFMRTTKKNCKNSQAFGVEDGAPRGAPFGSPVHQWIEFGRIHPKGMTPWDAHPQRTKPTDYVLTTDKNRYGNKRTATLMADHATRAAKRSRSSESGISARGSDTDSSSSDSAAAWDQYPIHSEGIQKAFRSISKLTGCSIYDMDLLPSPGLPAGKTFIVKYRPTEEAKNCMLVEGHRHKSNNAKFKLILEPLTLLAGCHSCNHPSDTPKWKTIFHHAMSPFSPPDEPSAEITLAGDPEAAYIAVPTTTTFRVRLRVNDKTVDITNLTREINYYAVKKSDTGAFLRLPVPSCIQFEEFINGPGGRNLVNKCYMLKH